LEYLLIDLEEQKRKLIPLFSNRNQTTAVIIEADPVDDGNAQDDDGSDTV
jgi:hypothetical protein